MVKVKKCKTCNKEGGYRDTDDHEFNTLEHPYDKPEDYDKRNEVKGGE